MDGRKSASKVGKSGKPGAWKTFSGTGKPCSTGRSAGSLPTGARKVPAGRGHCVEGSDEKGRAISRRFA